MASINRHTVLQRIALVYDTCAGAQADGKSIKKYVKELRKSVGLKDESAGDGKDFIRDFGRGI